MIKNPTHLIFTAVSVLIFIASVAVPTFLYMQIRSTKAYINEVQSNLSVAARQERVDSLTRDALLQTQQARTSLDKLAVGKDEAALFISAIESEGRAVGAKLEVGNVIITPKDGVFDVLSLNFQATGDFSSLSRLLKLIETLPYASSVQSVIVEKKDEKGVLWTLTAAVSVPIHK